MPSPTRLHVLVVGSGAREHALVQACLASASVATVAATPGNAGIAEVCPCWDLRVEDVDGIARRAFSSGITLAIVGPEAPLALGLADRLGAVGIPVFGPRAATARLESSKIFAKEFLVRHGIPTARAKVCSSFPEAVAAIRAGPPRAVVKADGLCAGKGVVVASSHDEAEAAARAMLVEQAFGEAGARVLVEECLEGREASIHVLVSDGVSVLLPTSQDHKRALDGDRGPNTGGMGAYSPAVWITPELLERIRRDIVVPTIAGFAQDGLAYRGVLFIGIMVTDEGPKVLEFNVRFGDPETEVILPRLDGDVAALLDDVACGRLDAASVRVRPERALCVVVATAGYPGTFPKDVPVRPPPPTEGVRVFHGATRRDDTGRLVSCGGRVLAITGLAQTLREAAHRAYAAVDAVEFASKHARRDIGWQELRTT